MYIYIHMLLVFKQTDNALKTNNKLVVNFFVHCVDNDFDLQLVDAYRCFLIVVCSLLLDSENIK